MVVDPARGAPAQGRAQGGRARGGLGDPRELLRNRQVRLFSLGIFCYVGTEQGVANWISEFLRPYHGFDPQTRAPAR